MNSNIVFKSNIYPVKDGFYSSDLDFLSNVWDYERLHYLDGKISIKLPEIQAKILKEQPYCSLNKDDPCWGVINTEQGYKWACRCTKSECEFFDRCRDTIPYVKEQDDLFAPRIIENDEYGYEKEKEQTYLFPIKQGLCTEEYNYTQPKKRTINIDAEISMTVLSHKEIFDAEEKDITEEVSKENDAVTTPEIMTNDDADKISVSLDLSGSLHSNNEFEETITQTSKENPAGVTLEAVRETHHEKHQKPVGDHLRVDSLDETKDDAGAVEPKTIDNIFDLFHETTQESIIGASCDQTMFVDAGPGTGKTYTLIHKLNNLVTVQGANPESIVVLCFTNSAVNEIRNRLKSFVQAGGDRGLVNIDIRTFHSFAWWIITQANDSLIEEGWSQVNLHNLSYDESLIIATKVMQKFPEDIFENWEHFIVDEVQDLTGNLGRMVLQMVQGCIEYGSGVSVLGDSCQAIYDYDQNDTFKSDEFYRALCSKLGGGAKYYSLLENHRQSDDLIDLTNILRKAILSGDAENMKSATSLVMSNLEKENTYEVSEIGKTCLLMRTNAQTLKFSSDLRKRGVSHYLNVSEPQRNYAQWISDVFCNVNSQIITESQFTQICNEHCINNTEEIWRCLTRLMHTDNNELPIGELLDAIANSKIDNPILKSNNDADLIVSNIHRAKGREYESVYIDSNYIGDLVKRTSTPDEYRTLYVALTRPKTTLKMTSLQKKKSLYKIEIFKTRRSRWGSMKNGKIQYLEFDSSKDLLPENFLETDVTAFENVRIGDEIILKREATSDLTYQIIHEETDALLGKISGPYILDFLYRMKLKPEDYIQMPYMINDLYVAGIYSQVVDREYLNDHVEIRDYSPNGVWKWIDIVGVGHASYDVY